MDPLLPWDLSDQSDRWDLLLRSNHWDPLLRWDHWDPLLRSNPLDRSDRLLRLGLLLRSDP